jgi:Flp pilus assembly protein TadG
LVRRRTGIFKTSKASLYSDERGQLLVITAVAGLMLVSVAALSINAAFAYDRRNRLYAAADAAAKSGAIEVERNASISQTALEAFANQQVAAHGFTPAACGSLTGTSVCVYHPPVSGPYLGNSNFVEAVVSHRIPTFFGTVLALTQMNPGARAVGRPRAGTRLPRRAEDAAVAERHSPVGPGHRQHAAQSSDVQHHHQSEPADQFQYTD